MSTQVALGKTVERLSAGQFPKAKGRCAEKGSLVEGQGNWLSDLDVSGKLVSDLGDILMLMWPWVNNLCLRFGADEHPCTTYFDVHQGYRVLTHSHVCSACQFRTGQTHSIQLLSFALHRCFLRCLSTSEGSCSNGFSSNPSRRHLGHPFCGQCVSKAGTRLPAARHLYAVLQDLARHRLPLSFALLRVVLGVQVFELTPRSGGKSARIGWYFQQPWVWALAQRSEWRRSFMAPSARELFSFCLGRGEGFSS